MIKIEFQIYYLHANFGYDMNEILKTKIVN